MNHEPEFELPEQDTESDHIMEWTDEDFDEFYGDWPTNRRRGRITMQDINKEIAIRVQTIMALQARVLYLEDLMDTIECKMTIPGIMEDIANCKAALDGMNAEHYVS